MKKYNIILILMFLLSMVGASATDIFNLQTTFDFDYCFENTCNNLTSNNALGIQTEDSVIFYQEFNSFSDNKVYDQSNSNYTGQIVGGMATVEGQYLDFDGVDDCVNIDNSADFPSTLADNFTIETEVYLKNDSAETTIIWKYSAVDVSYPLRLYKRADSSIRMRISNKTGDVFVSSAPLVEGWYKLKTIKNGTAISLYVNDSLVDSDTINPLFNITNSGSISIGCRPGVAQPWNGTIKWLSIKNTDLNNSFAFKNSGTNQVNYFPYDSTDNINVKINYKSQVSGSELCYTILEEWTPVKRCIDDANITFSEEKASFNLLFELNSTGSAFSKVSNVVITNLKTPEYFTIIAIPDTQHMSYDTTKYILNNITQFINSSFDELNTQFVFQLGDNVQDWNNQTQWTNINNSYKVFEDENIPYTVALGNHDANGHQR